jgi:hypothetical protein
LFLDAELPAAAGFIQTMLDWMGGLKNDPNDAFFDLNILRMEDDYLPGSARYSVLSSIHQNENSIVPIRGVISANNSLADLLSGITYQVLLDIILKLIDRFTDRLKNEFAGALNAGTASGIEGIINDIETVINTEIMAETVTEFSNPALTSIVNYYQNGIPGLAIPKNAHDFIIPSSYQLTCPGNLISRDLNTPNFKANHISGSSPLNPAGIENINDALKFLETMI